MGLHGEEKKKITRLHKISGKEKKTFKQLFYLIDIYLRRLKRQAASWVLSSHSYG